MAEVWITHDGVTTWEVRDVTWCGCGDREVGEGLTRCVMCEAERPNP